jgi:hypothetical protein
LTWPNSVKADDIDTFIDNAAWAIRSTYHTVLKASPGAAIFGQDMLFDIPFNTNPKGLYTPQIRVHLEKRTMDHNDSSYKWNYQDSMRNQIGKN